MYGASKVNDQPMWAPFHVVLPKPVRYNLLDKQVYQIDKKRKMKELGNHAFLSRSNSSFERDLDGEVKLAYHVQI